MASSPSPNKFHELLSKTRKEANHTVDSMAILLALPPDDYEALENGKYPDEETLIRLCRLMEWNYIEAKRLILNEMISPHHDIQERKDDGTESERQTALQQRGKPELSGEFKRDTLPGRLLEVREQTGQSKDIISMLLKISVEEYDCLEAGEAISDGLLRRISVVYDWNYNELKDILVSDQARTFTPHFGKPPFAASTAMTGDWRKLSTEMGGLFERLNHDDQKMMLAQLELIRDTMRRHQKITA